jgi:hypothetical protein
MVAINPSFRPADSARYLLGETTRVNVSQKWRQLPEIRAFVMASTKTWLDGKSDLTVQRYRRFTFS